jgi:rhamnose transport system permease protein
METSAGRTPGMALALKYLPEIVVVFLLLIAFTVSAVISPSFFDARFLVKQLSLYVELGVLALACTPVIITGNLDLSVASSSVMTAGIVAFLHAKAGMPMGVGIFVGLILGACAGTLNGFLVSYVGLSTVLVTLGTLALYRGIAQILLGLYSIQDFPSWFVGINNVFVPGTGVPISFVICIFLALVFAVALQKTVFGRWVYAIGTNERAAQFAGVPVKRMKFSVFLISGVMSAIAGMMMVSRLGVARYDLASGYELQAIIAVILGGTSILGGRGTIFGTFVAVLFLGILQSGLGMANVKAESQLAAVGFLLVFSVISTNLLTRVSRRLGEKRGGAGKRGNTPDRTR